MPGFAPSKDRLTRTVQAVTGDNAEVAFVDQGYTGDKAAEVNGIKWVVVRLPEAKKGFVLLPRCWVVERSFAWATRFRRLVKDYERYATPLAGPYLVAFVCLILKRAALLAQEAVMDLKPCNGQVFRHETDPQSLFV